MGAQKKLLTYVDQSNSLSSARNTIRHRYEFASIEPGEMPEQSETRGGHPYSRGRPNPNMTCAMRRIWISSDPSVIR